MPKHTYPKSKFFVAFNIDYTIDHNGEATQLGEGDSFDFYGDDRDALAAEVILNDPKWPMQFVPNEDKQDGDNEPIGWFVYELGNEDEEHTCAVMLENHH